MKKLIIVTILLISLVGCFGNSWDYVKHQEVADHG
jgi:hypothetical protein